MDLGLDYDDHFCKMCEGNGHNAGIPCKNCKGTGKRGNMEFFEPAVKYLVSRFGREHVLVRKSSSGKGCHVRVRNINITQDEEMAIRVMLHDCKGRRIADMGRRDAGMKTSRLFTIKSKTRFSKDLKEAESSTIKRAGEWRHP